MIFFKECGTFYSFLSKTNLVTQSNTHHFASYPLDNHLFIAGWSVYAVWVRALINHPMFVCVWRFIFFSVIDKTPMALSRFFSWLSHDPSAAWLLEWKVAFHSDSWTITRNGMMRLTLCRVYLEGIHHSFKILDNIWFIRYISMTVRFFLC